MSLTNDWLDTFKRVLTQPTEFFESEDRRDGFGYPLKFATINLVISGILGAASLVALGGASAALEGSAASSLGIGILAVATLILTPILGIISLLISSGLIHIFAALLGAEQGYSETLSVMEYGTAIQPITSIFSMIPLLGSLVGLIAGLYGLFIQTRGLQSFQELSLGRALAAILLPAAIIIALVILIAVAIVGASLATLPA